MEPFWAIELGQWILEDLMKHKGQTVWVQQRGKHQSVLFLPISLRTEAVLWPIVTYMKAHLCRTCEDSDGADVVGHISVVDEVPFIVIVEFSFGLWRKKVVWSAPSSCFVFVPEHHEKGEQALVCLRSKQFGMEDMLFFFETLRKETGFLFRKPTGMYMGKTCVGHWNLLKEKEYSTSAETSPREWGTGLCDQKCHGKKCALFTAWHIFCSSGPVIHLLGLRFTDPF